MISRDLPPMYQVLLRWSLQTAKGIVTTTSRWVCRASRSQLPPALISPRALVPATACPGALPTGALRGAHRHGAAASRWRRLAAASLTAIPHFRVPPSYDSAQRLTEYKGVFGFTLSEEEVASISAAGREAPRRLFWTHCPAFCEDPREEAD